jgi:poly(A) polymerase
MNAMAVRVADLIGDGWDITVIDPMDGLGDMYRKVITSCPGAFADDPLRMVRAFRFSSMLGYRLTAETRAAISARVNLINLSAAERISSELDLIMTSGQAHQSIVEMDKVGLLEWLIPELQEGDGVDQPAFHHLDVLQHNILTLYYMERIIEDPRRYFGDVGDSVVGYLGDPSASMLLKWAALFHDIGKPDAKNINPEKNDRITFYGHDHAGVEKIEMFAERMRWSRKNREKI